MLYLYLYESVKGGVSLKYVESVDFLLVLTGGGGRTKYLEGKIGTPSSKYVALRMQCTIYNDLMCLKWCSKVI